MLDFLFGMLAGKALFSSKSGNVNNGYEKVQIQKVLEIGNAINLMGSTLPPDTDITEAVKKLKLQFASIDGSAIHMRPDGRIMLRSKNFSTKTGYPEIQVMTFTIRRQPTKNYKCEEDVWSASR